MMAQIRFPEEYDVVGQNHFNGGREIERIEYYVKGGHTELRDVGKIEFVPEGGSGELETKITVYEVPSENYIG